MAQRDDELQYQEVINLLKGLKQIEAPPYFESNLFRAINSQKNKEEKSSFLKFLSPARLIPSLALAVTAIIILFMVNVTAVEIENPLLLDPREREDVVAAGDISIKTETITRSSTEEVQKSGQLITRREPENRSFRNASQPFNRAGLNFRQINLTPNEKAKIIEMREKLLKMLNESMEK
jgi:hypothetical protein